MDRFKVKIALITLSPDKQRYTEGLEDVHKEDVSCGHRPLLMLHMRKKVKLLMYVIMQQIIHTIQQLFSMAVAVSVGF